MICVSIFSLQVLRIFSKIIHKMNKMYLSSGVINSISIGNLILHAIKMSNVSKFQICCYHGFTNVDEFSLRMSFIYFYLDNLKQQSNCGAHFVTLLDGIMYWLCGFKVSKQRLRIRLYHICILSLLTSEVFLEKPIL